VDTTSRVEVLLESVIIIDHLKRVEEAREYLETVRPRAAISVITRAETLTGYSKEERRDVGLLLDEFPTLDIGVEIADLAAVLRRRNGWKLPDAFQAALAQHHGLRLATRNTRDFPPERFPFVVVPYQV
jgi:predicted nucleic acid-binding protein